MVRSRSVPSPSSRITRTHETPRHTSPGGLFLLEVPIDPKPQNRKPPPSGPKRTLRNALLTVGIVAAFWALAALLMWLPIGGETWGGGVNPLSTP
jgi:hypothetical protein